MTEKDRSRLGRIADLNLRDLTAMKWTGSDTSPDDTPPVVQTEVSGNSRLSRAASTTLGGLSALKRSADSTETPESPADDSLSNYDLSG